MEVMQQRSCGAVLQSIAASRFPCLTRREELEGSRTLTPNFTCSLITHTDLRELEGMRSAILSSPNVQAKVV